MAVSTPLQCRAMPANDLMKHIHNTGNSPHRVRAILRHEGDNWLSGNVDEARIARILYKRNFMVAHAASIRVNTLKNNDSTLINPV